MTTVVNDNLVCESFGELFDGKDQECVECPQSKDCKKETAKFNKKKTAVVEDSVVEESTTLPKAQEKNKTKKEVVTAPVAKALKPTCFLKVLQENQNTFLSNKEIAEKFNETYYRNNGKEDNMNESIFWTRNYLALMIEIGLIEKKDKLYKLRN